MTWYDNPASKDGANWWVCPDEDRHPRCCWEGCECGAEYAAERQRSGNA